jgi:hypothetical protein
MGYARAVFMKRTKAATMIQKFVRGAHTRWSIRDVLRIRRNICRGVGMCSDWYRSILTKRGWGPLYRYIDWRVRHNRSSYFRSTITYLSGLVKRYRSSQITTQSVMRGMLNRKIISQMAHRRITQTTLQRVLRGYTTRVISRRMCFGDRLSYLLRILFHRFKRTGMRWSYDRLVFMLRMRTNIRTLVSRVKTVVNDHRWLIFRWGMKRLLEVPPRIR